MAMPRDIRHFPKSKTNIIIILLFFHIFFFVIFHVRVSCHLRAMPPQLFPLSDDRYLVFRKQNNLMAIGLKHVFLLCPDTFFCVSFCRETTIFHESVCFEPLFFAPSTNTCHDPNDPHGHHAQFWSFLISFSYFVSHYTRLESTNKIGYALALVIDTDGRSWLLCRCQRSRIKCHRDWRNAFKCDQRHTSTPNAHQP